MDKKLIQSLKEVFDAHQKFAIVTHRNPDGDAIGSSLAMGLVLESLGKEMHVIFPNAVAPEFEVFPHMEKAIYTDRNASLSKEVLGSVEVLICLDFNTLSRVGPSLSSWIEKINPRKILIDHHENPQQIFDVVYSEPDRSSTAEMVYEVILSLYPDKLQLQDILWHIYAGILTDTGGFRFSTSARTHSVAAHLIQLGLDTEAVYRQIYQQNTFRRIQLRAYLLHTQLIHLPKYNTSYIVVSSQTLKKFSCQRGDYEGVVNIPLTVKNAKLSCIFVEEKSDGRVKLSLRSSGNFSVAAFAADHFDGGGHQNAAGAVFLGSLDDAVSKFLELLVLYERELE